MSTLNRKLDKENRKLLRQQSPLCSADRNRNSASAKVKVNTVNENVTIWTLFDSNLRVFMFTVKQEKESEDDDQPGREEA